MHCICICTDLCKSLSLSLSLIWKKREKECQNKVQKVKIFQLKLSLLMYIQIWYGHYKHADINGWQNLLGSYQFILVLSEHEQALEITLQILDIHCVCCIILTFLMALGWIWLAWHGMLRAHIFCTILLKDCKNNRNKKSLIENLGNGQCSVSNAQSMKFENELNKFSRR